MGDFSQAPKNRWLYPDDSIEDNCYSVPIPARPKEDVRVVEKEAKHRVTNIESLRVALVAAGWTGSKEVLQTDEYFDTKNRFIEASDFAVRIRSEDDTVRFAFKGPRIFDEVSSSRVEIELSIAQQCNGSRSSPASFSRCFPVRSSHSCLTVSAEIARGPG